jgi:hypothetical protein
MNAMLERLAEWYLTRRGRVVLPRAFVGFAVGNCVVTKTGSDGIYDVWQMLSPKGFPYIALNRSMVTP